MGATLSILLLRVVNLAGDQGAAMQQICCFPHKKNIMRLLEFPPAHPPHSEDGIGWQCLCKTRQALLDLRNQVVAAHGDFCVTCAVVMVVVLEVDDIAWGAGSNPAQRVGVV